MGRKLFVRVIGAIVVVSFLFFTGIICEAQAITIKYSDHDPPGGMRPKFLSEVWFPEIVKQTEGKVKIQDFWGGALLSSQEALKGIGSGVTHMGFIYPGHYPGQLVSFTAFKLFPRGPSKFENMAWLYHRAFEEIPELNEELTKANVKPLLFTAGLPGAFCSTKPLKSIDDIKGQKWRAGDKWAYRFLENAGAVPVSVAWDDVFMALQTGTITGCFTNYDGLHLMKFDEAAPNLLVSKELWYAQPFLHLVNIDFWNKLPKDVQDGMLKASEIAENAFSKVYDETFDKIVEEERAAGCTVTFMSEEDIAKWENADKLQELQEQWVKEAKEAGLETAPSVMEKMRTLVKMAIEREQ